MFPACLDAEAFLGAVADCPGDGPQLGAGHLDVHRHHAGLVAYGRLDFARRDRDCRYEAGSGHCAPQVERQAALVGFARLEARDRGDVPPRKEVGIAADHLTEHVFSARLDREGKVAFIPIVIDQQLGLVDFGESVSVLAERAIEVELLLQYLVALKEVAGLDIESVTQQGVIWRCIEIAEIDRAVTEARTGNDVETD